MVLQPRCFTLAMALQGNTTQSPAAPRVTIRTSGRARQLIRVAAPVRCARESQTAHTVVIAVPWLLRPTSLASSNTGRTQALWEAHVRRKPQGPLMLHGDHASCVTTPAALGKRERPGALAHPASATDRPMTSFRVGVGTTVQVVCGLVRRACCGWLVASSLDPCGSATTCTRVRLPYSLNQPDLVAITRCSSPRLPRARRHMRRHSSAEHSGPWRVCQNYGCILACWSRLLT